MKRKVCLLTCPSGGFKTNTATSPKKRGVVESPSGDYLPKSTNKSGSITLPGKYFVQVEKRRRQSTSSYTGRYLHYCHFTVTVSPLLYPQTQWTNPSKNMEDWTEYGLRCTW